MEKNNDHNLVKADFSLLSRGENTLKLIPIGIKEEKGLVNTVKRIHIPEIFKDFVVEEHISDNIPDFNTKIKISSDMDIIDRLINERNSLLESIENFKIFLLKDKRHQSILLDKQLKIMEELLEVLDKRLEELSKKGIIIDISKIAKRNIL